MKTDRRLQQIQRLNEAIAAIENSRLSRRAKERGIAPLRRALAREKQLCAHGQ